MQRQIRTIPWNTMLVVVKTIPGVAETVAKLNFPNGVIVFPRREATTLRDSIHISLQHLEQLKKFEPDAITICFDWFAPPERASDFDVSFLQTHAVSLERHVPGGVRRIFVDIEPVYAFDTLIKNCVPVTGSFEIHQMRRRLAENSDITIPVGARAFDVSSIRDRIAEKIIKLISNHGLPRH